MKIKIEGLRRLDSNLFDQIIIEENYDVFTIKILGSNTSFGNDKFTEEAENDIGKNKILSIIQNYLNKFGVNGITTKLPPLIRGGNEEAIVYSNNGSKQLRLKLYNPKFRVISEMVKNKYLSDRYDYFWNENISSLVLESSSKVSRYDIDNDSVKFVMRTDDAGNILRAERDFIGEFLFYKFSQIGEVVNITRIVDEHRNGSSKPKGYIIHCGDMRITFPHRFEFSPLLSIIEGYNMTLLENKKRRKKN